MGGVILRRPATAGIVTACTTLVAAAMIGLFVFGSFTKRATVHGQLVPERGLVRVFVPQQGIVIEKKVREGDAVAKDQVLYVISSDLNFTSMGETQAGVIAELRTRAASLEREIALSRQMHAAQRAQAAEQVRMLQLELADTAALLEEQEQRVKLLQDAESRYEQLFRQGHVSQDLHVQRRDQFLQQRTNLLSLRRTRRTLEAQLQQQIARIESLPLEQQGQISGLERTLSALHQELRESESKRNILVRAPAAGVLATAMVNVGQLTRPTDPLAVILPQPSALEAHLFVPSRAIGFVQPGDAVRLRYAAFPYQKFGQQSGTVTAISTSVLSDDEVRGMSTYSGLRVGPEPVYRVTVALSTQTIHVYGLEQTLLAGMVVEADVARDTRRLYEWAFEPAFAMSQ